MNKIMSAKEAISHVKDGDVVMFGGFLQCGSPERLLTALAEDSTAKGLTFVNNDTGREWGAFKVMSQPGRVVKVHATWIGGNPVTGEMFRTNPASVVLTPQGTFSESIRAAGYGIPEFLTPTGVGTVIAEGKETRVIDGKTYLVEKALHGDVALVHAAKVDEFGNCYMRRAAKNFSPLMPLACKYTIVEAEEIVPVGAIDPDLVTVSGVFVNAIVKL